MGGTEYTFSESGGDGPYINAQTALDIFSNSGLSPLTKWQTHMYRYIG